MLSWGMVTRMTTKRLPAGVTLAVGPLGGAGIAGQSWSAAACGARARPPPAPPQFERGKRQVTLACRAMVRPAVLATVARLIPFANVR
jgi:hypothetical protein